MTACLSCGAALPAGAQRCDLCGTPAGRPGAVEPEAAGAPPAEATSAPAPSAPRYCNACGQPNPADARFCNACGAPLAPVTGAPHAGGLPDVAPVAPVAATPPAVAAAATRPPSDVGRQALALVGLGLAVVVGLYGLSVWSEGRVAPSGSADGGPVAGAADGLPAAAPIPEGTPALPDSAQADADAFEREDTAASWYESGRYYLTAAFQSTASDPVASAQWARRAIANFERSLEIEPDPTVRLALAEAATFDPSNPMRPVQELQGLLEDHPDHPGGNFLLGERRLLIGRLDSAAVSFQRALAAAEPGDPVIARAQQGLQAVEAARARQAGG